MKAFRLIALGAVLMAAAGCNQQKQEQAAEVPAAAETAAKAEPTHITVQHILIGFEGSVPGKASTRSKEEAAALAAEVFKRAQDGENFDDLVKEYTDDAYPGIYKMANRGTPGDMAAKVFNRDDMVPAFGDVGFPLEVGEIGMAEYDAQTSPYGWHIIKRVM